MASSIPARSGCVFGPVELLEPKQTVKISQFRRCPDSIQRQTNRNPAFQCALCIKVTTALRGFTLGARGLVARGVIHTSGDRRSVRRDAVVEWVRRGSTGERTARPGSYLKRNSPSRTSRVPEISPSRKAPLPIPPNPRRGALDACSGLSATGEVRVVPRRGGCGVLLQR